MFHECNFCGTSEAKRHIGITVSVICLSICLSCFAFAYATCIPQNTGFTLNKKDCVMLASVVKRRLKLYFMNIEPFIKVTTKVSPRLLMC